jgi:3-hydroxyacyl-[acyl-carrier-protein] dehydratase
MPAKFLFDISAIDLTKVVHGHEDIREVNPQRDAMEMLDAIVWVDEPKARLIGYKDITVHDFWVPGHIPGRPLLPGVMMIEAAAQLASFYTRRYLKWTGFVGFGGLEDCKFRMQVAPPCRLFVVGEKIWDRHGRICCKEQGIVNGSLAFETTIIGVKM